jgi:hypothetical protein
VQEVRDSSISSQYTKECPHSTVQARVHASFIIIPIQPVSIINGDLSALRVIQTARPLAGTVAGLRWKTVFICLFYWIWPLFTVKNTDDQAANVLAVKHSEPSIYRYTTHVKTAEPNMAKEAG